MAPDRHVLMGLTLVLADWKRLGGAAALVAGLQGVPCAALAQPAPDQEKMAQRDVDAGVKHFRAREFHEAYVRFKSAAAVYPSPHVRTNMVVAGSNSTYPQERVESARAARVLLREGKTTPEDTAKVNAALSQLQSVTARIEVRASKEEAVRIDGALVEGPQLNDPYDVLPGTHEVLVGLEKHQVDVDAGSTAVVTLGQSEVTTSTPPVAPPVAPPRDERLVPRAGRPIVMGVLGGLAVASLGTGLATFLVGSSARSDAKDASNPSSDRFDAADRANTMRTVSTITVYAGLGLAVATVVPLLVWPKKKASENALHFAPVVGPGHLGLRATF